MFLVNFFFFLLINEINPLYGNPNVFFFNFEVKKKVVAIWLLNGSLKHDRDRFLTRPRSSQSPVAEAVA
jgi:hypothetical protein